MRTLSIAPQPPPAHLPKLDMTGIVALTARVYPKRGQDFVVCNPMDEIIEASESNEPFVAHMVVGMQPKRVIIEPNTIARIEEL